MSSKQLTTFSDHRLPLEAPDHISLPDYVEYLRSYCDHFKLWPNIKLGCLVTSIKPLSKEDKWRHRIVYHDRDSKERQFDASHIAICTGLHVQPNEPPIPGIENVKGGVFHSCKYKTRSQLSNQDVLILGCGETAMGMCLQFLAFLRLRVDIETDIAYEAIKADAKSVTMCFRTGFLSFPKALSRFQVFGWRFKGGLPIDGLITNLFETAYVHRAIAASRLRWFISDFVIKRVLWFLTGTMAGMNQHIGALPNDRLGRAYVFLNKSNKAMPYLNRPYKPKHSVLDIIGNKYIDTPEDANSDRWVDTCTFPMRFDSTGRAIFTPAPNRKDWKRLKDKNVRPSCVVFCTGYEQVFSWLDPYYPTAGQANIRNIINIDHPDIAYIGFVRPGVGAIPPIAEQQALWWTALITSRMDIPKSPPHYHLLAKEESRIKYGVDHSAYMSVLARDYGGAPGLRELYRRHGFRILLIYSFGASFVTFYRLTGPFAFDEASEIVRTELGETILRRGVLGNLFFGFIPMAFYGVLNGLAWLLDRCGLIPKEKDVA